MPHAAESLPARMNELDQRAAAIWAKDGIGIVEIVWDDPVKIKVKFWHGGCAWLRQGDMVQGYITSSGVVYVSILRRKNRN